MLKLKLTIKKKETDPPVEKGVGGDTKENTQGVPFEILEALHKEVLDRLDARGVADPAWLDGIDFNAPAYSQVKDRLNQVWLKCLEGGTTLEEFKRVLADYKEVVLADTGPRVETQGRLFNP